MSDILRQTRARLITELLAQRDPAGHWEGELSTSALSTATAIVALHLADPDGNRDLVQGGARWLAEHANQDGGWGDTTQSYSNISTTLLCWAALNLVDQKREHSACLALCERHITEKTGTLEPQAIAKAVMARYQEDHTFSVPILTMLTICGCMGSDGWQLLSPLPFELAAFPQSLFRYLNLRVVSYALPALIAIGQVIHHHRPSKNPVMRLLRNNARAKTLKVLSAIQPANGGFLEAVPLTSFVAMSLVSMGHKDHEVVTKGLDFLKSLVRQDGSWPIDTHLATWVTTLSINTLGAELHQNLPDVDKQRLLEYLLNQQYTEAHPFTGAAPGGWAWSPHPGGVPDADDTSGAVLALALLDDGDPRLKPAAKAGIDWLVGLQNRDGGMPTFCRGWGKLPFDCSCPDITAHFLQALLTWKEKGLFQKRWQKPLNRAVVYLEKTQHERGYWLPLWFGNQDATGEGNPAYGTSKVLMALQPLAPLIGPAFRPRLEKMIGRATLWLESNQNADGGWGGDPSAPSTIEETALVVQALAFSPNERNRPRLLAGLNWLAQATEGGTKHPTAPIGFYFANLWYFEKLYPLIFATGAFLMGEAVFESQSEQTPTLGETVPQPSY